jgi:hypothetical protein
MFSREKAWIELLKDDASLHECWYPVQSWLSLPAFATVREWLTCSTFRPMTEIRSEVKVLLFQAVQTGLAPLYLLCMMHVVVS